MASRATLEVQGLDGLSAKIAAAGSKGRAALHVELIGLGHKILVNSDGRVPVRTGALRDTGQVYSEGDDVIVGYGGGSVDYAVYVHEILSANHPNGEAKFLERAALEEIANWKSSVGSGGGSGTPNGLGDLFGEGEAEAGAAGGDAALAEAAIVAV